MTNTYSALWKTKLPMLLFPSPGGLSDTLLPHRGRPCFCRNGTAASTHTESWWINQREEITAVRELVAFEQGNLRRSQLYKVFPAAGPIALTIPVPSRLQSLQASTPCVNQLEQTPAFSSCCQVSWSLSTVPQEGPHGQVGWPSSRPSFHPLANCERLEKALCNFERKRRKHKCRSIVNEQFAKELKVQDCFQDKLTIFSRTTNPQETLPSACWQLRSWMPVIWQWRTGIQHVTGLEAHQFHPL